jgi:hypothetical protein
MKVVEGAAGGGAAEAISTSWAGAGAPLTAEARVLVLPAASGLRGGVRASSVESSSSWTAVGRGMEVKCLGRWRPRSVRLGP